MKYIFRCAELLVLFYR